MIGEFETCKIETQIKGVYRIKFYYFYLYTLVGFVLLVKLNGPLRKNCNQMLLCSNGCTGIMMYEGETEKESRDSLNMVEQMKIMYGAIKLAVIHGATLSRGDQRRGVNFICFYQYFAVRCISMLRFHQCKYQGYTNRLAHTSSLLVDPAIFNLHAILIYRMRSKEWPFLALGLITTFLLRLLQSNLMSSSL